MEEFVCISVWGKPGEEELSLKQRLTHFWTGILREIPDEFEKVYAESIEFEKEGAKTCRRYAIEPDVVDLFVGKLAGSGFEVSPYGDDDIYTKHELPATEWWQIEH